MAVIEIEDYDGNTICYFKVKGMSETDLTALRDCELADTDGDYLFQTDDTLYRIQLTKKLKEK